MRGLLAASLLVICLGALESRAEELQVVPFDTRSLSGGFPSQGAAEDLIQFYERAAEEKQLEKVLKQQRIEERLQLLPRVADPSISTILTLPDVEPSIDWSNAYALPIGEGNPAAAIEIENPEFLSLGYRGLMFYPSEPLNIQEAFEKAVFTGSSVQPFNGIPPDWVQQVLPGTPIKGGLITLGCKSFVPVSTNVAATRDALAALPNANLDMRAFQQMLSRDCTPPGKPMTFYQVRGGTGTDLDIEDLRPRPGTELLGAGCITPAYDVEPVQKPDGSVNFCFDPLGFSDVLLMIRDKSPRDDRPLFSKGRKFKSCTATRIGDNWAITARHCLQDQAEWGPVNRSGLEGEVGDSRWGRLRGPVDHIRLFALSGDPESWRDELYSARGCLNSDGQVARGDCGYSVVAVTEAWMPRGTWPTNARPTLDIALLKLSPLAGQSEGWSRGRVSYIAGKPAMVSKTPLSFAGYGISNLQTFERLTSPLVSFSNKGRFEEADGVSGWTWTISGGDSYGGPCSGDSGGAVYYGYPYGLPAERHQLLAVVSYLTPNNADSTPGASVAECLSSKSFAEPISRHVTALCRITGAELYGCPDATPTEAGIPPLQTN